MTDTKFSDFIRNATPEEKAKVYGEVIDEACEMQRKVMTDTEEGRVSALMHLIGDYWDVAYAEGRDGRKHDTRSATAQECWTKIIHSIDTLARQLAEARAEIEMHRADRSRLIACPWRVEKGFTSHCQPPKRLREALDQAEAAERRAAAVEKKCSELVSKWRAVAVKQTAGWQRAEDLGDDESAARWHALKERSEYVADELEAAIAAGEVEGG